MKLVLLTVFVFFFVALPTYALNVLLMPELNQLKQAYQDAGQTAENLVQSN